MNHPARTCAFCGSVYDPPDGEPTADHGLEACRAVLYTTLSALQRVRKIVYRATVEAVSQVDVTLAIKPAADGEDPITVARGDNSVAVNVPGAANAEDVGDILRAFGAIIGINGAARITIAPK